jgi:hypothetical protein
LCRQHRLQLHRKNEIGRAYWQNEREIEQQGERRAENGRSFIEEGKGAGMEWLKSYRIWDADRKEFIYPENWLEPERWEGVKP